MESQYFYPFKYHLGLCVKKIIFILKKSKYRRTVSIDVLSLFRVRKSLFLREPEACFSKVPIINGPGKLLPFTLKTGVSVVLHLT